MGVPIEAIARTLQRRASTTPDRIALTLISDRPDVALSYADLHNDACAMVHQYSAQGIGRGDVIFLSMPLSRGLIAALIGAFYKGAVPAILPHDMSSPQRLPLMQQFKKLVIHAKSAGVVVTKDRAQTIADLFANDQHQPAVISVPPEHIAPRQMDLPKHQSGSDIAYLQYTSGTTGFRKGAALSNDAIATCVSEFADRMQISNKTDIILNWLPLYHDFGLFAGLITPLLTGTPAVLMAPDRCMRRPHLLMRALDEHRATMSWATNSALQFFANHTSEEKMGDVDLSHLRVVCAGGEPTRFSTLQAFVQRFEPFGLNPNAVMSGYGMAETTMGVSVCDPAQPPRVDWVKAETLITENLATSLPPHTTGAIPQISNGFALPGSDIQIVDQAGNPLPRRHVGNIRVRGKTVLSHYHNNSEATQNALVNDWLITNDTGYLAEGHLYVIGRRDDRIMAGGKTIHPEELETLADTHGPLVAGKTVVFGVFDECSGTEKVVMVCAVKVLPTSGHDYDLEMAIRTLCKQHLDISIDTIAFRHKNWVVTADNGKMARQASRAKYLSEQDQR